MSDTASLYSLFISSFLAATLLPGGSEAVLFGVLKVYPETLWLALTIATIGNTLGGMVTFGMGWLLPQTQQLKHVEKLRPRHGGAEPSGAGEAASQLLPQTAGRVPHLNPLPEGEETIALSPSGGKLDRGLASNVSKLRRYGTPALLLAWVPLIGDALCLTAGWLRLSWWQAALFMAAGKFARYWVIAMSMRGALIFSQ